MLERFRPSDSSAFRDMADQEHGNAAFFGEAHQPCGTLAHLAHVARRAFEVAGEHRLDGIDDHDHRRICLRGREYRLQHRLAEQ